MKRISIKLTRKQLAEIKQLATDAAKDQTRGTFGILGQAFIPETERFGEPPEEPGTAYFYFCNDKQFRIINRAIMRAKKA